MIGTWLRAFLAPLLRRAPEVSPSPDAAVPVEVASIDTAPMRRGASEPPPIPRPPPFVGGLERVPVGRHGLVQVYGDPKPTMNADGKLKADINWERKEMVLARDLPGYAKPLYVHRKVEPYFREALRRALEACPEYPLTRIGCFSPRRQRHLATMPLSLHTWGVAFDINPDDNFARTLVGSVEPWSDQWRRVWPQGLPRPVVEAFESVGFEWGGRWRGFVDPMHFQLLRTR